MTRSEAIKILWQYDVNFEPHPAEDVMHAIDMAIEALEQEQQRQEDIYECQYCFGEVHKNYIYCPFCGKRIEALEQEETLQNLTKPNKSDLIVKGAGEIKDGLYNIKDGKLFKYKANGGTVRTYPIVSAGWIPCSERLPERDELVLVTYKTTDKIHLCKYLDDGSENSWWSYKDDCCAWNNVVIAWMPLPEAYREDGEEE